MSMPICQLSPNDVPSRHFICHLNPIITPLSSFSKERVTRTMCFNSKIPRVPFATLVLGIRHLTTLRMLLYADFRRSLLQRFSTVSHYLTTYHLRRLSTLSNDITDHIPLHCTSTQRYLNGHNDLYQLPLHVTSFTQYGHTIRHRTSKRILLRFSHDLPQGRDRRPRRRPGTLGKPLSAQTPPSSRTKIISTALAARRSLTSSGARH